MFSEIDHVAITTSDLEKHLHLFRDTLGLNVLSDFEVFGSEWERTIGIKGVKFRRVELQKNNANAGKVALLKFEYPESRPFPSDKKPYDIGIYDLGFMVFDMERSYKWVEEGGFQFDSAIEPVIVNGNIVAKEASIKAPDGVHVMLAQSLFIPSEGKNEEILASGVDHCVLVVRDLEKSLKFYRDVLGLKPIIECSMEGGQTDRVLKVPNVRLKLSILGKENMDLGKVQVMQYLSHQGKTLPADFNITDCGITYLAFKVEDLDESYHLLKERNVRLITDPILAPMGNQKIKMFFVKDFDGIFLMFFQPQ